MEGEGKKAPSNDGAFSGDATGENGRDHGDSAPVNPIDRTLWVTGVRQKTSMLESEEKPTEEAEHSKADLPQGFYIIEAIRRTRVRKGQKQYLIKWHNYPEKDNTWEPLENLNDVSDIIDAFEESQSAKQRKPKHKHVTHGTQLNKRLQRSTTPYSLRCFTANGTDDNKKSLPIVDVCHAEVAALPQDVHFASEGDNNGCCANCHRRDEQPLENGSTSAPRQAADKQEENGYEPELGELNALPNIAANGTDADRLVIQVNGTNALTGDVDDPLNVDGREPAQNARCRGAKRRKSGPVKRFIRDPHVSESVNTEREINNSGSAFKQACPVVAATEGNNGDDNRVAEAEDNHPVVKIIKAIDCVPPQLSNTQEPFLTF